MYSLCYEETELLETADGEETIRVPVKPTAKEQFKYETDDKLPESANFPAETPDEKRRADWRANHLLIERSIMYLMHKNGRPATNIEIAERTGLSERAVRYHLENVDLDQLFSHVIKSYAPLADEIMMSVVKSARNGTNRAQQLYFEIVFGWKPGQRIEIEKPHFSDDDLERMTLDIFRRQDAEVQELLGLSPEVLYAQIHANRNALMHILPASEAHKDKLQMEKELSELMHASDN